MKTRHTAYLAMMAFMVLWLFAGCNKGDDTQCSANDDCAAGYICTYGGCFPYAGGVIPPPPNDATNSGGDKQTPDTDATTGGEDADTAGGVDTTVEPSWHLKDDEAYVVVVGGETNNNLELFYLDKDNALTFVERTTNPAGGEDVVLPIAGQPFAVTGAANLRKMTLVEMLAPVGNENPRLKVQKELDIEFGMVDMKVSLDGKWIYVLTTNPPLLTVYGVNLLKKTLVYTHQVSFEKPPKRMAVNPTGNVVWVSTTTDTLMLVQLDKDPPTVTTDVEIALGQPGSLGISPDGSVLMVLSESSDTFEAYSVDSINLQKVITSLSVGTEPDDIFFTPDSSLALVNDGPTIHSVVFEQDSTPSLKSSDKLPGLFAADSMTIDPRGKVALALDISANQIFVITINGTDITMPTDGVSAQPNLHQAAILHF